MALVLVPGVVVWMLKKKKRKNENSLLRIVKLVLQYNEQKLSELKTWFRATRSTFSVLAYSHVNGFQGMYHLYILYSTRDMCPWHLEEHLRHIFVVWKTRLLDASCHQNGCPRPLQPTEQVDSGRSLPGHLPMVWSPGSVSDEQKINYQSKGCFSPLGPLLLLDSYSVFKFDLVLTACMVPLQDFCSSSLWLTYPSPDPAKSPTMNFIPRFGSALVSFLLNKLLKINSKGS